MLNPFPPDLTFQPYGELFHVRVIAGDMTGEDHHGRYGSFFHKGREVARGFQIAGSRYHLNPDDLVSAGEGGPL